eukprot:15458102-Alexandrium_andersonii.AAC.1
MCATRLRPKTHVRAWSSAGRRCFPQRKHTRFLRLFGLGDQMSVRVLEGLDALAAAEDVAGIAADCCNVELGVEDEAGVDDDACAWAAVPPLLLAIAQLTLVQ